MYHKLYRKTITLDNAMTPENNLKLSYYYILYHISPLSYSLNITEAKYKLLYIFNYIITLF